ncbi:arginase [Paenibacillus protaetiae]|uniref:Arginase n=1 Tax=Paenibacillus protaetiae TaxID=2509456 RepID=A0A4P6ETM7_9BACL|nr:arginase [Paenibacillus protaetiae]QAY65413.1 arginase [Paenibacillus protaetiae]
MQRDMEVLLVPFGQGAGRPGSEWGPEALVKAGLLEKLEAQGCKVNRSWVVPPAGSSVSLEKVCAGEQIGAMKHSSSVRGMNRLLAQQASAAVRRGRFPLLIGGDHSLAMGMLAGISEHYRRLGVIWLDAHADMNTEATSPSGNMHGIPLAVAMHVAELKLADIWPRAQSIDPRHLALVGARDIDPGESRLMEDLHIRCFSPQEIKHRGAANTMLEALQIAQRGTDGIHLSFDVDSLDPQYVPGTGTPVQGGLVPGEIAAAFGVLRRSGKLTSMDVVEVNPQLDQPDGRTARLAAGLVASLFNR